MLTDQDIKDIRKTSEKEGIANEIRRKLNIIAEICNLYRTFDKGTLLQNIN